MIVLKYIKEFLYLFSGITVLFAMAVLALFIFFVPWGVGVYIYDVMGYSVYLAFGVIISFYLVYYCVGRHFGFIEEVL